VNWPALTVFVALFLLVTVLGFVAARWRAADLTQLHEWGLGGRRFGTIVTWFLLGGDLYTAYTFIAVPALVYGAGALGFFAVPYTILVYPILYLIFPKLWILAHERGYITASDIVEGQYNNKWLALAVGITGIVATMPYIALQLVGMQVVIGAMGVGGTGLVGDLPLIIAFLILAAFTYTSGLRAPAMIAVVKDILIYIVVIAVTIGVPLKMGGFGPIFAAVPAAKLTLAAPAANSYGPYSIYATLALGSAFALFLYPHSLTAILSGASPHAIRRNAALLPAYSLVLGLLALLGFMAVALKVNADPAFVDGFKAYGASFAVPALILSVFPSWFAGLAFAAIAIGALVPSAIMSIACANIVSRTIYKGFLKPNASAAQESGIAKLASLVVKAGALVFIIFVPVPFALQFQLLGGLWIIQILPSLILGLYWRFLNGWALLIGWGVGTCVGTWMASTTGFKAAVFALSLGGMSFPGYIALWSVIVNIVVAVVLSVAFTPFERVKPRKA
jgi:SSS family solute:Na+ symporter